LNQPPASAAPSYAVLSGGIGGAKLVLGLQQVLAATQLQVIANTGDDFEHLGLPICPDIDTLIYTLAGIANPETGWGLRNESWQFMAALEALGGATWFRLGDRDLATHVRRRDLLQRGQTLSEATTLLRLAQNVSVPIWPMSDAPVRTLIETAGGPLEFQDYFVRQQAQPVALGFRYSGSESARASSGVLSALNATELAAIILTPSNPWLSIAPILSIDDIKATITANAAPVIAVSPIVNGAAIKGPTAKLMRELGIEPSVNSIAMHYRDILDGLVIDTQDRARQDAIEAMGIRVYVTNTVMQNLADKAALAQHVLDFAAQLRADRQ
jgi:LPPG:FO 2-phospho-L-lactate transferase